MNDYYSGHSSKRWLSVRFFFLSSEPGPNLTLLIIPALTLTLSLIGESAQRKAPIVLCVCVCVCVCRGVFLFGRFKGTVTNEECSKSTSWVSGLLASGFESPFPNYRKAGGSG